MDESHDEKNFTTSFTICDVGEICWLLVSSMIIANVFYS